MATRPELVEAHAFARRRLVTAFLSGAPGGREVDPSRPGRTVVGGVALAVLVAAGAAIAGLLDRGAPEDWTSRGLVVSEETGQAYVILPEDGDPVADDAAPVELRPVANLTSAALILGPDVEPVLVPQDVIDQQQVGGDVGIPGAPAFLPPADRLVGTGWTACTADRRGIRVRVALTPDLRPSAGAAVVVTAGRTFHLVASEQVGDEPPSAYALPLPAGGGVDNMLAALGLPARALAPRVPRAWIDLFPSGAALDWRSFGLTGAGGRPATWDAAGVPASARVGDVLVDTTGRAVLLTVDGPADLDPFASVVYAHSTVPGGGAPAVVRVRRLPDLTRTRLPAPATHWPTALPEHGAAEPCAVLTASSDAPAVVQLAQAPGAGEAADDVGRDRVDVGVDPGHGAFVLTAGRGGTRRGVVVDSGGRAHRLGGDGTAHQLGYAGYPAPVVPGPWVDLFAAGVLLSTDRALCPPSGACDGAGRPRSTRSTAPSGRTAQ
ncbi:MAG TPA: type VII secretion protein EccB [Nocardioides sp.]|nr:type VII secretion protein EccB [Nocardioides sp.]